MKKKKLIAVMLGAALCVSMLPTTALAAKGDLGGTESGQQGGGRDDAGQDSSGESGRPGGGGSHGGKEEESYSGTELTIPEGIVDGNYVGKATVNPDEDGEFDAYDIEVTLTMQNGSPVSFSVSGANGRDGKYSGNAQTGIQTQIAGKAAGTYAIDTVSGATCSSTAIVQGLNAALKEGKTLSGTYYEMENTITYDAAGSSCLVTVHRPEKGMDYRISLAYGVGKFSDDLEPRDDYCSVEKVSETNESAIYKVTMKPDVYYEIADDDLTHKLYVNHPGTSLSVKVNNDTIGTFQIKSEAVPSISNNKLTLTGGKGDTLAGYIDLISEVTVSYTNANDETVSETYSTSWQHDMEAAFLGSDLFNEDGSINFDLTANVTLTGDDFEALKDENGNNITQEVTVFPNGAEGDYQITVSAGEGYDVITADIGKSYAPNTSDSEKKEETNKTETPAATNTAAKNETVSDTKKTDQTSEQKAAKEQKSSADSDVVNKTTVPKTDDGTLPVVSMTAGIASLAAFWAVRRRFVHK